MLLSSLGSAATALRANPVRALLATLGVVIGSASLVAVMAVSDGVEHFARQQVSRRGYDVVQLRSITEDSVDGQWIARDSVRALALADLEALGAAQQPGEQAILMQRGLALPVLGKPARRRALSMIGVAMTAPDTLGRRLVAGRHLTPAESRSGEAVIVVNEAAARAMLPDSGTGAGGLAAVVGNPVPLGDRQARVVGVVADEARGDRKEGLVAFAPLAATTPALVPGRSRVVDPPQMTVRAARAEDVQAMRTRLERWLDGRDAAWRTGIRLSANSKDDLEELRRMMLIFRLLVGSFTGITLIVGGIGIMNVLLASVAERTREIGLRKAVGARRRDILFQFLAESVTITAAGSVIGSAVGLAAAYGVTAIMRSQTKALIYAATTSQTLLISAAAAITVGLLFGCYPAMRAARMAPVEAMYTE